MTFFFKGSYHLVYQVKHDYTIVGGNKRNYQRGLELHENFSPEYRGL